MLFQMIQSIAIIWLILIGTNYWSIYHHTLLCKTTANRGVYIDRIRIVSTQVSSMNIIVTMAVNAIHTRRGLLQLLRRLEGDIEKDMRSRRLLCAHVYGIRRLKSNFMLYGVLYFSRFCSSMTNFRFIKGTIWSHWKPIWFFFCFCWIYHEKCSTI